MNHAVSFFDRQFAHQVARADYALNPFEQRVLPFLAGDVLDLGCGLGNLALAAAQQGCRVTACDGSATGIARLQAEAVARDLAVDARCIDLNTSCPAGSYDAAVSIGLLMFFARPRAEAMLHALMASAKPGGIAAVNVLIEGTTYLDMFDPNGYTLFAADELERSFAAWRILDAKRDGFDAPGGTRKEFSTVIARRPQ